MSRRTRRQFLIKSGAVSIFGVTAYAGLQNQGDKAPPAIKATNSNNKTTSTTNRQSTEDETSTNNNYQIKSPQTFESFETLDAWSAVEGQGTLKKSTKQPYAGSQSARIIGSNETIEGKIHRINFGSDPADFHNKNFSLAFKCTSHDFVKVAVQLYAPDQSHVVEMKRTLYGPKGKWVRVNLGVTSTQRHQTIDLSRVYEVRIIGRPVDPNSTTPVEFYVDDVKTVPTPNKGMVMLTFDEGRESQYSVAYNKYMKKYRFRGVGAIIPDAISDDGFITQPQMKEMMQDGWDMIARPNVGANLMSEIPPKEQEQIMKDAKSWLKQHGYEGYKYIAIPKNVVGPKTFDLAKKHFDITLAFGGSPNALPAIQKETILSRIYGDNNIDQTKQMVDYAAEFKQLSILFFHRIGTDGMSEKNFEAILQHLKQSNVEVVTITNLKNKGMLM
ncbi:polysaccharide deacetylase family protein [Haladaptatus sp. NG-WS-4]